MRLRMLCLLALLVVPCAFAQRSPWRSRGEITAEGRQFTDDNNPVTRDGNLALFSRIDTKYRKRGLEFAVRAFARVDAEDASRDLAAFEEAWIGYRRHGWEIRGGFQMLNWTATEAFHPADVMNSRNLDSQLENPEKLGELMLSMGRRIGQGELAVYYMPRYETPELPEASSRLSFVPAGLTLQEPLWIEDDGLATDDKSGTQWGIRFNQTIGDVDFSVYHLAHLDRQHPSFSVSPGTAQLQPVYSHVRDTGLTYLQIVGGLIVKVEAAHKDFVTPAVGLETLARPDHTQAAFGLEYGWINGNGSETTMLVEGQGFFGVNKTQRLALSPFQRDLLLGVRYTWNDIMGRELLATLIADTERSGDLLVNLRYSQRLSDTWSLQTGLRVIDADGEDLNPTGLSALDEANQIYLHVSRFF